MQQYAVLENSSLTIWRSNAHSPEIDELEQYRNRPKSVLEEIVESLREEEKQVRQSQHGYFIGAIDDYKTVRKSNGTEYWSKIKAHQARNWDGSFAGYAEGTPDGDRSVTQKLFVPDDEELPMRYTNYW